MATDIVYTGKEWDDLLRGFSKRQIRNTLKRSYRKVGNGAKKIAAKKLSSSGLEVKGSRADWEKGIRLYVYSKGGGFMLTVKARAAKKNGSGELSMHTNRKGFKKPVLMWAEEGTQERFAKPTKFRYEWTGHQKLWARHGAAYKPKRRKIAIAGRKRGQMPAYDFMKKSEPEAFRYVEGSLVKELETATVKVAKKAGFV